MFNIMAIPIFLKYINKIIYIKEGAFKMLGILAAAPPTFGLYKYFDIIFSGADVKKIYITLGIQVGMLLIFGLFSSIDMVIGIQASLQENATGENPLPANKVIKSNKLWSTFWKSFGVIVLTAMLTFIAIISIALEATVTTWITMWALMGFWFMACCYEFYSIGENIGRRNEGKKPRVFQFFDKVLEALQQKAIDKINDKL